MYYKYECIHLVRLYHLFSLLTTLPTFKVPISPLISTAQIVDGCFLVRIPCLFRALPRTLLNEFSLRQP